MAENGKAVIVLLRHIILETGKTIFPEFPIIFILKYISVTIAAVDYKLQQITLNRDYELYALSYLRIFVQFKNKDMTEI